MKSPKEPILPTITLNPIHAKRIEEKRQEYDDRLNAIQDTSFPTHISDPDSYAKFAAADMLLSRGSMTFAELHASLENSVSLAIIANAYAVMAQYNSGQEHLLFNKPAKGDGYQR